MTLLHFPGRLPPIRALLFYSIGIAGVKSNKVIDFGRTQTKYFCEFNGLENELGFGRRFGREKYFSRMSKGNGARTAPWE